MDRIDLERCMDLFRKFIPEKIEKEENVEF
jgi:hypothetical protein